MRFDEKHKVITLEQDIQDIWTKHGWELLTETVSYEKPVGTWIIKAKAQYVAEALDEGGERRHDSL